MDPARACRRMTTRFAELRRAFRTLDEDASGNLDRNEFKSVLVMFNLGIPEPVMEKLIDLADFDGDGSINFAEVRATNCPQLPARGSPSSRARRAARLHACAAYTVGSPPLTRSLSLSLSVCVCVRCSLGSSRASSPPRTCSR